MWEKVRADGKKKLKNNAVPTLFTFTKPKMSRKPPKERSITQQKEPFIVDLSQPSTSVQLHISSSESAEISESDSATEQVLGTDPTSTGTPVSTNEIVLMKKKYENIHKRHLILKKKLKSLRQQINRKQTQKIKENDDENVMKKIFSNDQIQALKRKTRYRVWSNETVEKALRLKFSCGTSGYAEILKQGIPLPSLRTLTRRLQGLRFESGILEEVIRFLKLKVDLLKDEHEKDCVIVLDEMAIKPSKMYDTSTKQYIGDVSLPEHSGIAVNALVVMIAGITSRWKQTVAYYFTSKYIFDCKNYLKSTTLFYLQVNL